MMNRFLEMNKYLDKFIIRIALLVSTMAFTLLTWFELPKVFICIVWGLAAIILTEADRRYSFGELRIQGYILIALSSIYAGFALYEPKPLDIRLTSAVAVILCSYYLFGRSLKYLINELDEKFLVDGFSWTASLILAFTLWRELPQVAVSLAWAVASLLLFEISGWLKKRVLYYQSVALLFAALFFLFFGNFTHLERITRLFTILPVLAAGYYFYGYTLKRRMEDYGKYIPDILGWTLAIIIAVWFRFEFLVIWRPVGWAFLMIVFFALGMIYNHQSFRLQSYLLVPVVGIRLFANSAHFTAVAFSGQIRFIAALLTLLSWAAIYLMCRKKKALLSQPHSRHRFINTIETYIQPIMAIAITVIIMLLLYLETQGNFLTFLWAIEGLALLMVGMLLKERAFRWSGLCLFVICVMKVFLFDMRGLETIYKIISFIGLGFVLLLVSYLYSRYRAKLVDIL